MTSASEVVAWLRKTGDEKTKAGMARYAIPSDNAFGVGVGVMKKQAKVLGRDHSLASALWKSGLYEARMMAVFLDEPELVTSAQMDAWCRDFDSWAIVDTACFHLFDRTPHAWKKVHAWAKKKDEFQKRAAFALLASLVAHDKTASDAQFIEGLALIEVAADDERNFVSKGVNWALRCVGRRNAKLKKAAMGVAMRLAAKEEKAPRWVGKDALREFRRSS